MSPQTWRVGRGQTNCCQRLIFSICPTATNLCFGEKNVYTSEVLAVVMQQLMEQNPLPMLLMRTVIQSLTMYPRLGGFVMNILSRLIVKQVSNTLILQETREDHLLKLIFFLLFRPAGVEVSKGVGGIREVLPEDKAAVVQRALTAATRSAHERVRALPGDEGASSAARPLLHASPGDSCFHIYTPLNILLHPELPFQPTFFFFSLCT